MANTNTENSLSFYDKLNIDLQKLNMVSSVSPGDLPGIDLYMDQLLTFLNSKLDSDSIHDSEKALTKTMINNYTKKRVIPSPDKKRYSKDHIYLLTLIYYLKNLLTIDEIHALLEPLTNDSKDGTSPFCVEDIYEHLYNIELTHREDMSADIVKKSDIAKQTFSDISDKNDRDYLQMLSLVTLLSFDVCLKKSIVEDLIANFQKNNSDPSFKKDSEKAVKKAEKERESAVKKKEKAEEKKLKALRNARNL